MAHDDLVAKINEFTRLTKERELTSEEAEEREKFRGEYLKRIRTNMRGSLEGIEYKKK